METNFLLETVINMYGGSYSLLKELYAILEDYENADETRRRLSTHIKLMGQLNNRLKSSEDAEMPQYVVDSLKGRLIKSIGKHKNSLRARNMKLIQNGERNPHTGENISSLPKTKQKKAFEANKRDYVNDSIGLDADSKRAVNLKKLSDTVKRGTERKVE